MTKKPTYSVVIPCYNGGAFLRETIDSALAQTHLPLEVIVIDDGSTDESAAIAKSFGPPVRVIRQENQGESVARNRGIDEARGEWVAFLDADDLWKPEKIENQLAQALAIPNTVAVHTWFEHFGACNGVPPSPDRPDDLDAVLVDLADNRFHPSSLLLRSDVTTRFEPSVSIGEDTVFYLDLISNNQGRVSFIDRPLVLYRKHPTQQTSSSKHTVEKLRTLKEWLQATPALSRRQQEEGLKSLQRSGLDVIQVLKARRQWELFDQLRSILVSELGVEINRVRQVVGRRFPSWMYWLNDRVR